MNFIFTTLFLLSTMFMEISVPPSVYTGTMNDINGKPVDLAKYQGHVSLIVNVASYCGYTKQYAGLEILYRNFKDRGFVVLGFPANDFGAQEPGTDTEIAEFCRSKYDVTFPMFAKVTVKGEGKVPLFTVLTNGRGDRALAGEIGWNFEKFLIGKDGQIIKRYKSTVEPSSDELRQDIEAALK